VVEPAKPMLDICRQRTEARHHSALHFHEGYLTLCLFHRLSTRPLASGVSIHHGARARRNFFGKSHLTSHRWIFVSADLASGTSILRESFEVWLQRFSEVRRGNRKDALFLRTKCRRFSTTRNRRIASSGFDAPVLFFQAFLIHAWYAKRAA